MNCAEVIDEAVKFKRGNTNVKKRVGEWLQNLDYDGLEDLQEVITEALHENTGDDYVTDCLINLRQYADAEMGTKAKGVLFDLIKNKLKSLKK